MSPSLSGNYFPHPSVAYTKQLANRFVPPHSVCVKLSNFKNLFVRKFSRRAVLPLTIRRASLSVHICYILKPCSQSKMVWIAAISLFGTRVKNPFILWNYSLVGNDPRYLMRVKTMLYFIASNPNLAVSHTEACSPQPAFICLLDGYVRKEPILEVLREYLLQQFRRYKLSLHNSDNLIFSESG